MGAASERYERAALRWVIHDRHAVAARSTASRVSHGAPWMARQGVPMDGLREFDRSEFNAALRASMDARYPR